MCSYLLKLNESSGHMDYRRNARTTKMVNDISDAIPYRDLVFIVDGERQLNVMYGGAVRVQVWPFRCLILHQYRTVPCRSAGLGRRVGWGSWQLPGNEGRDDVCLRVVWHAACVDRQRLYISTYDVKVTRLQHASASGGHMCSFLRRKVTKNAIITTIVYFLFITSLYSDRN